MTEPARAPADELSRRRFLAEHVGGAEAVERQHALGMLTAPERIDALLDPGSHLPFGRLVHGDDIATATRTFGDGELCGFGAIDGRHVAYMASDTRVKGASGTPATFRHSEAFRNIVEKGALPIVHLMQGGGARMTDAMSSSFIAFPGTGLGARRAFPRRGAFLTAVMGSYYAPWTVAQADFSVMTRTSNISLTAPVLVEVGTGQQVTADELGGAEVQARISGQVDAVVDDDLAAIETVRRVFSYLPAHAGGDALIVATDDDVRRQVPELLDIVPEQQTRAYDVRRVISTVVDRDSFFEYAPGYARNLVGGLGRVGGRTVVIVANQPKFGAGALDVNAVIKASRLHRLCSDFGLPLVTFVDVPGVLPTKEQEHARLMTSLFSFATERVALDVPKVSVILRKGIGFALQAMSAGDPEGCTFAWPGAQIAFTGVEAAVRVSFRRQLEQAANVEAEMRRLSDVFEGTSAPWTAARLAYLDDVIHPAETRQKIARAIEVGARACAKAAS